MTDINKAIKELRDAINGGEGWPTIHRAYDALDKSVLERYGVNNPIDAMRQLDWALTKSATGTFVNVETYLKQLEEAVWVPSVTVIQAARDVISQSGPIIINEGRSNEVEVYTTDEKAIAVLRSALDALASSVEGGTVEDFDKKFEAETKEALDGLTEADIDARPVYKTVKELFDAIDTPSLTERIEAAAEEIVSRFGAERDLGLPIQGKDITAILKRHIEGGK